LIRANLAAKATRTGQCIDALIGRGGSEAVQKSWGGMKMFQEQQLRQDDPKRLRARENFAANLEDILHTARSAHVPVVLSTVASNLKDCAPFASMHRADLDAAGKTAWDERYAAGVKAADAGDPRAALEAFSHAAELDPGFADLSFRMGGCWLALSDTGAAKRCFEKARDDDALGFRADTAINQSIRRAGERHANEGVSLVDAVQAAATDSADGIPGEDLFYEHVHLNFAGNYLLARMFADAVAGRLPAATTARGKTAWASAEQCDRRLAVSAWDRYRLWQANFSRVSEPPFTAQLNDVPRARRYMARLDQLRSQLGADGQAPGRVLYEEALKTTPDDYSLRGNYAQFLGEIGNYADAVEQQRRVCELLPQSAGAFYKQGLLLVRKGDVDAARERYLQALKLRDDYVPALNELGLIAAHRQKSADAREYFAKAMRINRGYAETYLNLGFLEQQEGNFAQAMTNYHAAAELQPGGPAAYFNQAVGSVADHRRDDGVHMFQAAVWMDPAFWQARYLLGVELAMSEKVDEAAEQFSAVVHLRPDFAKAHVNLGVALAKRRKLDEALAEFQAALRLNPTNELARRSVEAISAMQDRK
jgi:tetratricopeptide (TPR) repeat protein